MRLLRKFKTAWRMLHDENQSWKGALGLMHLRYGICPWLKLERPHYRLPLYRSSVLIALIMHERQVLRDEEFIASYLKPAQIFVDVGANVGTLSLVASDVVGPSGLVVSFEAHPRTFELLEKGISYNRRTNIRAINMAVGASEGFTRFSDYTFGVDDAAHVVPEGGIEVPMTTLDKACQDLPHIDLLKIDVEGFEKWVIEGGKETLKKTAALYVESCPANFSRFGYAASDLVKLLEDEGFAVAYVDGNNQPRPTTSQTYQFDGTSGDCSYENLLATRRV